MGLIRLIFTRRWDRLDDFKTHETDEGRVRADLQFLHDETQAAFNQLAEDLEDLGVENLIQSGSYETLKYIRRTVDDGIELSADGTTWVRVTATGMAPAAHTHGNISNAGAIGTEAGLLIITGEGGYLLAMPAAQARAALDAANKDHIHGNISKDGKLGTTANLPVFTGADGVLVTKTAAQARSALAVAPTVHAHGNLTSDGKIGSAANLPVFTETGGIVGTKSVDDALKALGAQRSTPNEVISATWNESLAASSLVIKTISHTLGALPSKLIIRMINGARSSEIIMKYNGSSYDTLIYGTIQDLSNYNSTSYWTPAMVTSNYIFGYLSNFYCGGPAIGSLDFQLRSVSVTDTQVSFTIYNNSSSSHNISSNVTMEVYK